MKLTKDDIITSKEEPPLSLFSQGIKSDETRRKYLQTLRQVLCKMLEDILEGDFEQRVEQLVRYGKEDPIWTRDLLLSLSRKIRERTTLPRDHPAYLNPISFAGYFKPIKKLFDMNDVNISWKRLYVTYPELDNVSDTRGWEREEIQQILKQATNPIDRAIILVAASSGIRIGGFMMRWKDLTPIYKTDKGLTFEAGDNGKLACAMLRIYGGTSAHYPTFITPEAYDAIQEYKKVWIKDIGRSPRPDEPLFKQVRSPPKMITHISIVKRVHRMILKAGLRDISRKYNRRFDVPMMNGFRRFWNKTCKESTSKESPLASLIKKEFMMGHSGLVKLDRNYFKTHVLELAEEYIAAVGELTIDDNARLRQTNILQSALIRKMESDKEHRIRKLEDIVSALSDRV